MILVKVVASLLRVGTLPGCLRRHFICLLRHARTYRAGMNCCNRLHDDDDDADDDDDDIVR